LHGARCAGAELRPAESLTPEKRSKPVDNLLLLDCSTPTRAAIDAERINLSDVADVKRNVILAEFERVLGVLKTFQEARDSNQFTADGLTQRKAEAHERL